MLNSMTSSPEPAVRGPTQACVLILSYNGGRDTLVALESLQPQRAYIDGIFVSDNDSTDDTAALLRPRQEELGFKLLQPPENRGFAGGFNHLFDYALTHSRAPYFLVLNNDTAAEPGFFEKLLSAAAPDRIVSPMIVWMKDNDTVIQCAGNFDRAMMKMDNLFAGRSRRDIPPEPQEVEQTDGCCFLIHRCWLEIGVRFDPKLFIYFEDVELFLRLRAAGARFFYVPAAVLRHKEYGSSGGRETPSPFRNYYFYRNRLELARRLHPWPERLRVYWRLVRLALEKRREQRTASPRAARAILRGLRDGLLGRLGRRAVP